MKKHKSRKALLAELAELQASSPDNVLKDQLRKTRNELTRTKLELEGAHASLARLEVVATTLANDLEAAFRGDDPPCAICLEPVGCEHARTVMCGDHNRCSYFTYYGMTEGRDNGKLQEPDNDL